MSYLQYAMDEFFNNSGGTGVWYGGTGFSGGYGSIAGGGTYTSGGPKNVQTPAPKAPQSTPKTPQPAPAKTPDKLPFNPGNYNYHHHYPAEDGSPAVDHYFNDIYHLRGGTRRCDGWTVTDGSPSTIKELPPCPPKPIHVSSLDWKWIL